DLVKTLAKSLFSSDAEQQISVAERILDLVDDPNRPSVPGITKDMIGTLWITLGSDYLDRARGNHADNIEKAIHAFSKAEGFYTRSAEPSRWAMVQRSQANAYLQRKPSPKRADDIEEALQHARNALEVYTAHESPNEWVDTQL